MKNVFLGTVYARPNKPHTCFSCWSSIAPEKRSSDVKIRHDVWRTKIDWKNTVVNKYYCKCCENLLDTQVSLDTETEKPYNPEKREFIVRFPQMFSFDFIAKYPDIEIRKSAIFDLQMIFWTGAKFSYYIAHRIFKFKKFNGLYFRFDHEDYKKFKKTYDQTKNQAYILLDK